jgi:DNA-binding winged helix-turn-helix (wHTH) protein
MPDEGPEATSSVPRLEVNLRSPGVVRVEGCEVRLPPLSFELLAALAERPGEVVTRQALYLRLWPEGGPEEQQLDFHRRTLLDRLRGIVGLEAARAAEVIRGIGLRMTLPPEQVRLIR